MSSPVLNLTAGEVIRGALRDARIIASEQPVQAVDFQTGLAAIKNVLKHWQAQGLHLWGKREGIIPLVTAQRKYLLGPGGDEVAETDTFVNTTLTAAAAAAATTLTIASTTGMEGADNILTTDVTTSTQDWTAINSATLSISSGLVITNGAAVSGGAQFTLATTVGVTYRVRVGYTKGTSAGATFSVFNGVTVADATTLTATGTTELTITAVNTTITFQADNTSSTLGETSTVASLNYVDETSGDRIGIELDGGTRQWTDILDVVSTTSVTLRQALTGAAASGKSVFSYEEQVDRPLRMLSARFGETLTASEIPIEQWSRFEYFDQPDKDSSGTIVQWYYSPQLTLGELFVWQVAANVNQVFRFTYMRPLEIPTATTDTLDVPSEWFLPLKWAVAAEMGPGFGLPDNRQAVAEGKAAASLAEAMGHDVERDSMSLQPDFN